MPFDLNSLERGFGEVSVDWNGHSILVRYRADLNNRALIAMKRVMVGVLALDGTTRFPDVEAIIDELLKTLLPIDHEEGAGWDLTDNGAPLPITFDTLVDLPPGLPAAILGGIFRDINDPNRRKPSRRSSSPGAGSAPIESPITGNSSSVPSVTDSIPTTSVIPNGSTLRPEPLSLPTSNEHAVGFAGVSGTP